MINEPRINITRDVYDKASINTNTGTNAKGVPLGTNKAKKPQPCKYNPKITLPNHKANENDTIATNCAEIANE
ncbi:hypothetical protein KGF55_000086 (mitochondrion) [Candida pseudojiufengensis]|nr:hypothetical protein KGF55_000086 [Candida pseudojiufengensis]